MSLEVFSDASLGNVEEGKSYIGYVIGLVDGVGGRCLVAWKQKTGRRASRSTIEEEAISLGESLEMTVFLKEVWRGISGEMVKIVGRTDSKTLERAIVSNTVVCNRREAIKEGYVREVM